MENTHLTRHLPEDINHAHTNVMTVGIPLFDDEGRLKYAVCFTLHIHILSSPL